jgi:hypothetical protein
LFQANAYSDIASCPSKLEEKKIKMTSNWKVMGERAKGKPSAPSGRLHVKVGAIIATLYNNIK